MANFPSFQLIDIIIFTHTNPTSLNNPFSNPSTTTNKRNYFPFPTNLSQK